MTPVHLSNFLSLLIVGKLFDDQFDKKNNTVDRTNNLA